MLEVGHQVKKRYLEGNLRESEEGDGHREIDGQHLSNFDGQKQASLLKNLETIVFSVYIWQSEFFCHSNAESFIHFLNL